MKNPRNDFFYLGRVRSSHEQERLPEIRKLKEIISNLPTGTTDSINRGLKRSVAPRPVGGFFLTH